MLRGEMVTSDGAPERRGWGRRQNRIEAWELTAWAIYDQLMATRRSGGNDAAAALAQRLLDTIEQETNDER